MSFIPPPEVRSEAREGLEYIRQGSKAGTRVGRYRANQLANGRPVSLDTIKRMYSFFKRHEKNKLYTGNPRDDRGFVAWKLWGGDSGKIWVESILNK